MEKLAIASPELDMIRIVFENKASLELNQASTLLSDDTVLAFGNSCPKLRVIAITRCPLMTPQVMAHVLSLGSVQILDLHRDPESELGLIDDAYFEYIGPYLCGIPSNECHWTRESLCNLSQTLLSEIASHFKLSFIKHECSRGQLMDLILDKSGNEPINKKGSVKTINFFGQTDLSQQALINGLLKGWFSQIESISCNYLELTTTFLDYIQCAPLLRSLSIKECTDIEMKSVQNFLYGCNLPYFKRLYALDHQLDKTTFTNRQLSLLETDDRWFADEKLDIISLFKRAQQSFP